LGVRVNPDTIGYVWTGKFDLNTLSVDGEIFESGKKKLRIQKYPDTSGRGLSVFAIRFLLLFQISTSAPMKHTSVMPMLCVTTPGDLMTARAKMDSLEME